MAKHIGGFIDIINQLNSVDFELEEKLKAMSLLISLPESWSTTVEMISGQEKVYLDNICDQLIIEEIHGKE